MIIYISNQNNHGIGHTKKPLHARMREMAHIFEEILLTMQKISSSKPIIWW